MHLWPIVIVAALSWVLMEPVWNDGTSWLRICFHLHVLNLYLLKRLMPATQPRESSRAEPKVQRRPNPPTPPWWVPTPRTLHHVYSSRFILGGICRGYTIADLGPCVLKWWSNLLHHWTSSYLGNLWTKLNKLSAQYISNISKRKGNHRDSYSAPGTVPVVILGVNKPDPAEESSKLFWEYLILQKNQN